MQRPALKEPHSEKTGNEAAIDKKRGFERRDENSHTESFLSTPSSLQKMQQERKWTGGTSTFIDRGSQTGKSTGFPSGYDQPKGDTANVRTESDEQKFTTLTGKTYSFKDGPAGKQNQLSGPGDRANTTFRQETMKDRSAEPSLNAGKQDRSAPQPRKDDVMNAYIRTFKNAGAELQKTSASVFNQKQDPAANRESTGNQEPGKSPASLRERMTTLFSERKLQPELVSPKGAEEIPQQKSASDLNPENEGKPERKDIPSRKDNTRVEKGSFSSLRTADNAKNSEVKEQQSTGDEIVKTSQNEGTKEKQPPLQIQSTIPSEEKKLPPAPSMKDREAGEVQQPERQRELLEDKGVETGKNPAAESQIVHGSELFKSSAKKETEKTSRETTDRVEEESASQNEKTGDQKAPLREKSFIAPARERKGPADESRSTARGDGGPGQPVQQFSERAPMMTSWTSGLAAQEDVRSFSSRSGPTKDKDKFSSAADRQTIDAVERRERNFDQSQSDQDSSRDGSSQERAKSDFTRRPQGKLSEAPSQDRATQAPEQQPHDYFRKVTAKEQLDERTKVFQASKEQPLKHTMQAAQHASTSIESILKKSQKETWTGDEMAAKLIALLMKSSSEYTYDHSTRVIDLSVMLAKEMGIKDEQTLKNIEEGAMFHDIGEVELDLEKAPQGVKNRLSKYIGIADLKNCSFLHDIGKIKIPEEILYKPSRLTDEEYEILKQHPIIGEQILKPIPSLQHVVPVVRHHHERWDGKGYPDGLEGNEIPQSARIISITDAFDAMISDRPYRKGMPVQEALKEIKKGAGTQFDPTLVEAFLKVVEKQYL